MRNLIAASAAALALLLAACGEKGETPEQREVRRAACIADELALSARVRLANLDTAVAQARGTPLEAVTSAGYEFARAYAEHANRVARETAYLDSAAHAPEKEDSTRFAQQAAGLRTRAPAAGSVESNAIERWREDYVVASGNPDHPCNKPVEESE